MKRCPECNRTFDDTLTFCLIDGSILDAPFDPAAGSESSPQTIEEPEREVVTVVRAGGVLDANAPARARRTWPIIAGLGFAMLVGVISVTAYTWGLLSWELDAFLSPDRVLGIIGYGYATSCGAIMGLAHALCVIALLWMMRRSLSTWGRTLALSILSTAALSILTVPFLFWLSAYPNLDSPIFIKAVFVLLYSLLQGIVLGAVFLRAKKG